MLSRWRSDSGFSLLELLVVLALTSITVALVAPRLSGIVDAITVSGDRAEVRRQISDLPIRARLAGEGCQLVKGDDLSRLVTLPQGWKAQLSKPLSVSSLGVCSAAMVRILGPRGAEEWTITAPDCRVQE